MKYAILVLAFLSVEAFAADVQGKAGDDYSACMTNGGAMFTSPYAITPDGHFQLDPNSQAVVSKKTEGAVESYTLDNPSFAGSGYNAVYTLRRENGRAVSVEMRTGDKYVQSPFVKGKVKPISFFTQFKFNGKKCYVDQQFSKENKDGARPQLTFDRQLCRDLMSEVKKMGGKQFNQCVGALSEMSSTLSKHRARLAEEGKDLMDNFASPYQPAKPMAQPEISESGKVFAAVSSCNMTGLFFDGQSMDPNLAVFGFGMVPSGGMGGGFGENAPAEETGKSKTAN